MRSARLQCGMALVAIVGALGIGLAAAFALGLAGQAARLARERASDGALALAHEALAAYAAGRPIDAIVGPGYLPCPDLDDDGWAEPTCGSQSGHSGQAQRLGRLPWKTLGIDVRDGYGERLWYAVSSKHKGLLNCTVSPACIDMSPDAALGTITVRDSTGTIVHDGRIADLYRIEASGAAAVVIAPGPAIERWEDARGVVRRAQQRDSLAARADPANYLERAPGPAFADEDNATFVDRNDAPGRGANANGFIRGPVRLPDGPLVVNDRLAVLTYEQVMGRTMLRVAQEAAQCLRAYAARPENGGRYPWPAPVCRQHALAGPGAWAGYPGTLFGRIPLEALEACTLTSAASPNWWTAWRRFVFYALAPGFRPDAPLPPACADASSCIQAVDASGHGLGPGRQFAVIVAGAPLAPAAQTRSPVGDADVHAWLEGAHRELERLNANPAAPSCSPEPFRADCTPRSDCNRVVLAPRAFDRNDLVVVYP